MWQPRVWESRSREKQAQRWCGGVWLARRCVVTDEGGITSSPHCQIQQQSSFCSIKQLELWPPMTGSVLCSISMWKYLSGLPPDVDKIALDRCFNFIFYFFLEKVRILTKASHLPFIITLDWRCLFTAVERSLLNDAHLFLAAFSSIKPTKTPRGAKGMHHKRGVDFRLITHLV